MKTLTLDFETYYSTAYSLRKKDMSPVEYILNPQFQCTGLAVKQGSSPAFWVHPEDVQSFFDNQSEDVLCISHNALFDNCIAAWRYGWVPKLMVDTMGMARAAVQAFQRSVSLDKVAEHLGLGKKGTDLANVKNMRAEEIRARPDLYARHMAYGINDAELCYGIFKTLLETKRFPLSEIPIMDQVLRCAVEPRFKANVNVLLASLATIQAEKERTLHQAMLLGAEGKKSLMSNDQFAALLRQVGVEPPVKISGTTGKLTYAFAKSDQDFIDLLEHEDIAVQTLVGARLGHKSTIEETRHQRFINIAQLQWPKTKRNPGGNQQLMPMPLRYSGAHTHRLSGDWSLNVQNMGRGSKLRDALEAPEGFKVVAGDESQVEARFVVTLCGQEDVRQQFERGEDVYSLFATKLFGFPVTKVNKIERFIGKQCLGADTLVLTDAGWLPIVNVGANKVWDGLEWVDHQGLLDQGIQETQTAFGLTMTKDHEILTGHGWQEWSEVHTSPSLFQSALSSVSLPLGVGNIETAGGSRCAGAHAGNFQSQPVQTLPRVNPPVATHVQNDGGSLLVSEKTMRQCPIPSIESGYSIGYLLQSADAITQKIECLSITGVEVSTFIRNGETTEQHSSGMSKPSRDGITPFSTWTDETMTKVTNRVTSDLLQDQKTLQTNAKLASCKNISQSLRNVYDIANAGPRKRFTVMSSEGPVLVHNCILGLGFGLGKDKFTRSIPILAFNQMGLRLPYTLEEGTKAVNVYRTSNAEVKKTWKLLNDQGISALTDKSGGEWRWGPVVFRFEEIELPNGHKLFYHNLRQQEGGRFGTEWVFEYADKLKSLYGGKVLENVVQALARIVTMQAITRIKARLAALDIPFALQVHDELVFVVRDEYVEVTRKVLEYELRQRPDWLPNLPLDCETGVGQCYGQAK